jgi:hypothetical protein
MKKAYMMDRVNRSLALEGGNVTKSSHPILIDYNLFLANSKPPKLLLKTNN